MQSPVAKTQARVRAPLPDETVDVAIIGCGLGGLTAGAYLARQGLKVALFDSHYVAGGCATMFERGRAENRYNFDVGLHYIGDCGPDGNIPRLLRPLGIELDYVEMDPDGFDTIVLPDLTFRIPADRDLYRDRLVALFPKEKRGIDRYVRFLTEVDTISRRLDRQDGRMNARALLDVALKGRLLARYQNATIGALLDSCTQDERLRAVILGQSGDYGLPPSKVSALLHAGLANHYFHGAFYPKGGGQMIADAIADDIEAHGGSIHLRCGIEEILVEDGRAVGIRTEKRKGGAREIRARAVLSNADLKRTMLELLGPEHLPSEWVERAQGFEMGGAIFITFLGVTADMRALGMGASNYWCYDGYDFEAFYNEPLDADGQLTTRGCYITSATLKDPDTPGHAPEGVTSVEVMTLVPGRADLWGVAEDQIDSGRYRKDAGYNATKQRIEDDMVVRLDRLFPGSGDTVVFKESATPVSHTRYTRASDGTGYGLACTPEQFLKKRPGYRGPVDGMYLAGASTRAGHGIVGAMTSGRHSALRVAKDLGRPIG